MRLLTVFLLLATSLVPCTCFNHWVVTEDGKIEYQAASPFNLRQPFDLMAFMKQEERVSILKELKDELIEYKNEFELLKEFDSFDESFLANEPSCRNVKLVSSYDLYISTVLPLEHKGIRIMDHLEPSTSNLPGEPFCSMSPLPFSMYALEHLEGVQSRRSLVAPPERSVLASVDLRMEVFGSLVHHALKKNSTSWVLLDLATLYWRARGQPHHAVDCIRRALHYSPTYSMDIALLNLANILHRSQHSDDALVPLHIGVHLAPDVNVLHYTLGNIYAALNQLNDSVSSFQRCVELEPGGETSLAMYLGALCELKMEVASQERTRKLDSTQKKLDQFYENMELVQKLQHPLSATETEVPKIPAKRKGKKRREHNGSVFDTDTPVIDAVPVTISTQATPNTNIHNATETNSRDADILEKALEDVVSPSTNNDSGSSLSFSGEKIRSSNLRLVLRPLPIEDDETNPPTKEEDMSLPITHHSASVCLSMFYWIVLEDWCSTICIDVEDSSEMCLITEIEFDSSSEDTMDCSVSEGDLEKCKETLSRYQNKRPTVRRLRMKLSQIEDEEDESSVDTDVKETSIFDQIENTETSTKEKPQNLNEENDYPLLYHSLEFFPFNPLPDQLEKVIFPLRTNPLTVYDDPYWPRKGPCLELVQEVRENPHIATFTGTFLPPAARGADVARLFSTVPEDVPSIMRQVPRCTDIVELPFSMVAMDHLIPVADRRSLNVSVTMMETPLTRVLIDAVTGGHEDRYTFEESAHRTYAAMLQVGPQWALFNIASLYWRVVGDPENALECLRRAIHYAPPRARDVGLIGMANVLQRLGSLNEAIIVTRAALDLKTESPVGHYTLASIYSSQGDYIAASLHLRAALHVSVFKEALLSLKLIRCSLKFKEEQLFLRKKMHEKEQKIRQEQDAKLIQEVKDAVLSGKKLEPKTEPPLILDNIEPPEIPEMKVQEMVSSVFTGENAIRYLTNLALLHKARVKRREAKEQQAIIERTRKEQQAAVEIVENTATTDSERNATSDTTEQSESTNSTTPDQHSKTENHTVPDPPSQDPEQPTDDSSNKDKPADQKQSSSANQTNTQTDQNSTNLEDDMEEMLDKAAQAIKNNQSPVPQKTPPKVKRKRKTHDEIREEEIKRRFPGTRPWPTLEECYEKPPPRKLVFTSTWLSVTAKGAKIKQFIDFDSPLEHYPLLPYCHNDFEPSRKTLSHLTGMNAHPLMQYKPEKGLQEVLCNMDGNRRSLEEMATRIKISLGKHPNSWVVSNLAALYWRIVGQGQLAIKCLKHALHFSDDNARDVGLVSLSNVLYRSGFDMDALAVIHMSLEASPTLVVTHFTMANILAAQGFYVDASGFYESTLHYQPQFQPAADRLKSVRCLILLARKRLEDDKRKELEAEGATSA